MINNTSNQPKELQNFCRADTRCVSGFIISIWNENRYAEISDYLHDDFIDYSIPYGFLQNKEGLLLYLKEMALRISHFTEILAINTVDDFIFCKVRITATSLSNKPDENPEIIEGYRLFRMQENKIIAHWDQGKRIKIKSGNFFI